MPNAIAVLKQDHKRVRQLLKQLEQTTERGTKIRTKLLNQIEMEVKIHAKLEEEIFYPAFFGAARTSSDREHFYDATEEHHVVDMVLPELKATDPGSEQFGAKSRLLKELIEHHIKEEEKEMFSKAVTLLEEDELAGLGEQIEARRETMIKQWKNPLIRPLKKMQSVAEKFAPASLKNAKGKMLAKRKSPSRRKTASR